MIKDKVISAYIGELSQKKQDEMIGLLHAESWEKVLEIRGRIQGIDLAVEALNFVLENEDK